MSDRLYGSWTGRRTSQWNTRAWMILLFCVHTMKNNTIAFYYDLSGTVPTQWLNCWHTIAMNPTWLAAAQQSKVCKRVRCIRSPVWSFPHGLVAVDATEFNCFSVTVSQHQVAGLCCCFYAQFMATRMELFTMLSYVGILWLLISWMFCLVTKHGGWQFSIHKNKPISTFNECFLGSGVLSQSFS